jgi:ribosome maturation factor RimP
MVGELIDQTGWLEDGYTLEVSSPGLSRPLTTAKDFRFRVGETVRIFFADKARKETTAEIVAADNESVEFRNSDGTFSVPLAEIDRAKIIF